MVRFQRRPEDGLSLLEVLLAGFLLSAVLGGLALSAGLYERSLLLNGNRLAARQFAQRLLEESLAQGFYGVTDRTETQTLTWREGTEGQSLSQGSLEFQGTVTVTDDPPLESGGEVEAKNILVEVRYPEQNKTGKLTTGTKVFITE